MMKTGIKIISAKYLLGYKIEITFSDGKVNVFDYENLVMREHEESILYRNINNFKKFKIVNENKIAWGENWDMLLSLHTIYSKQSISFAGRKSIADKKVLVRIYIQQSVIDAKGGIESVQKKATEFLYTRE